MLKYSLCIGAYPGEDVITHLEKVKDHGFHGLEYYDWTELNLEEVAKAERRIGVGITATCTRFFNLVNPKLRESYLQGLSETIEACKKLGTPSIITQTGNVMVDTPISIQQEAMVETLKRSAELCEKADVVLEVEPLNGLVDHEGHFLQYSDQAVSIVDQVDSPHVKLLFDVYHQQITEGNVTRNATNYCNRINHYHIADNPGRHEPGTGELNFGNILKAIKKTGFEGFIGLECNYTIPTDQAIDSFKKTILQSVE
ncbi:TIM barrel protein [Bacillus sp. Cs-700]|uniref:TIM barrel protein n=1 Tax=Bacillus sp. Cs-700 TaxID=2589818 RepID=UPI001F6241CE|nr:TIM barrel protein [Bacillus sp. Cs-700]